MQPDAFTALVATLRSRLVRVAATIVGPARAEDAVQTALAAAWVQISAGVVIHEPSPWLYQCVRHSSLNVLRAAAARYEGIPLHDWMPAASNVELEVERRDDIRRALAAIAELPAAQRSALTAAAGGQRPAAIAEGMGVSGGAVRLLLHRARTTVRASQST